ncbi:hypothetical protein RCL1_007081 [Eukaryota sp. TZLM3-RCL]
MSEKHADPKLQHERRVRHHKQHGNEPLKGFYRYGPKQTLPNGESSGPNGCWFSESTQEVRRFKPSEECGFIFYPPQVPITSNVHAGVHGCDFKVSTNEQLEPQDPDSEFYKNMYM